MKILKPKKYSIFLSLFKYFFIILFILMVSSPIVFAGTGTTGAVSTNSVTIVNPLGKDGPQDVTGYINAIINIILKVAMPVVTLAIIYTGFLFVEAQGNPEKITKAKKALTYTLIGAALLLGALVVATAVKATVNALGSGV